MTDQPFPDRQCRVTVEQAVAADQPVDGVHPAVAAVRAGRDYTSPLLWLAEPLIGPDYRIEQDAAGVLRPVTPPQARQVDCYACGCPGTLQEFDPARGFLISHEGRAVPCRTPPHPAEAPDGVLTVPVEISEN